MNKHSSIKSAGSLLERASEMYDFGAALRGGSAPVVPEVAPEIAPRPIIAEPVAPSSAAHIPMAARPASSNFASISRERLAAGNFIAGLIARATGSGDADGVTQVLGVYTRIGWFSMGVGVLVLLISPVIKRLMHLDTIGAEDKP